MKKCPKCELNYIKDDTDELCSVCREQKPKNTTTTDNNKSEMEKHLLPILQRLPQSSLDELTEKELSFQLFKLRIPLLVKCDNLGKDHCKEEVKVGNSDVYRYYIDPYDINGIKYHICSQWAYSETEQSKLILNLCKEIK